MSFFDAGFWFLGAAIFSVVAYEFSSLWRWAVYVVYCVFAGLYGFIAFKDAHSEFLRRFFVVFLLAWIGLSSVVAPIGVPLVHRAASRPSAQQGFLLRHGESITIGCTLWDGAPHCGRVVPDNCREQEGCLIL